MEGATTQEMQVASRSRLKGKETDCPLQNPEVTLILAQRDPFWFSDLQNCKIRNSCNLSHYGCDNLLQQHYKTNKVGDEQALGHCTGQWGGGWRVHQWVQLWETKYHRSWRGTAKSIKAYTSIRAISPAYWLVSLLSWRWPLLSLHTCRGKAAGNVGKRSQSKSCMRFLVSHPVILGTNGLQRPPPLRCSPCWGPRRPPDPCTVRTVSQTQTHMSLWAPDFLVESQTLSLFCFQPQS